MGTFFWLGAAVPSGVTFRGETLSLGWPLGSDRPLKSIPFLVSGRPALKFSVPKGILKV